MNSKSKNILSIIGICLLIIVIFNAPQIVFVMIDGVISAVSLILRGQKGLDPTQIFEELAQSEMQHLGMILLLSSIAVITIFAIIKYVNLKKAFSVGKIQWKLVPAILLASLAGILASDIVNEMLDFPDFLGEQMIAMASTIPGMIAIGLVGPIAEEVTFRGALMNKLREKGLGPWATILISAFIFGAVHGNPVQIPFAMVVGVILGIIYCKTESLWLCCAVHAINNSYAVVMMNLYGDEADSITFSGLLGGHTNTYMTLGLCLILSVSFFYWYWKKA